MGQLKILLVDDDDYVRETVQRLLENEGFCVAPSASVSDALGRILTQHFDVLISNIHITGPQDGCAVVTAMHHVQPEALVIVISGYPDVHAAMAASVLHAHEVMVKPFDVTRVAKLIRDRRDGIKLCPMKKVESVADILERETHATIGRWLVRARQTEYLASLHLSDQDRTFYLIDLLGDICERLREVRIIEVIARPSSAAVSHGKLRHSQGYQASMLVHESRILQVSIFETIKRELASVDFASLMPDIMLIADEVDSQLTQSVASYWEASKAVA
jgi:ActR/RegA family two-component response regulator